MKILLVDDVKAFLNLERAFLARAECQVLTARTGLEAVKVATVESPDIIMLDIEMPEMNGLEATRILRRNPRTASIQIIIVSSAARETEALAVGANAFLHKPVDEETFLQAILAHVPMKVRQQTRVKCELSCGFQFQHVPASGVIRDISVSGIFLETPTQLQVGDSIDLSFKLREPHDEKLIMGSAIVVRVGETGYGLTFSDLSEGARLYIEDFVTAHETHA